MAFGINQASNPTPAHINRAVRIISVLSGVFLTATQSAEFIPNNIQTYITWTLGLAVAISNALAPFFGVEVDAPMIPADQVKSIETDKK